MERLTKRYDTHVAVVCDNCDKRGGCYDGADCAEVLRERLAAYEDILFAPDGTQHITIKRLSELVTAEQEGRNITLPVKIGDTVYTIDLDCHNNPDPSKMCFCWHKSCRDCDKSYLRVWENHSKTVDIRSIVAEMGLCGEKGGFGKTVFLTRAAAEAALKGAEHERD